MKFLDEDIVFKLGNRQEGYHNYQVIIWSNVPEDEEPEPIVIYNGRFYIMPGSDGTIDIDITDILANYRYIYKIPTDFSVFTQYGDAPQSVNMVAGDRLIALVAVKDITQADGRGDMVSDKVVFTYRYPNANYTDIYKNWNEQDFSEKYPLLTLLQSSELFNYVSQSGTEHIYSKPLCVPRYPLLRTDNYGIPVSFLIDNIAPDNLNFILADNIVGEENVLWTFDLGDYNKGSIDFRYSLKDWFYKYESLSDDEFKSTITGDTMYCADLLQNKNFYGIRTHYKFVGRMVSMLDKQRFLLSIKNWFGQECYDAIEDEINNNNEGYINLPLNRTSITIAFADWADYVKRGVPESAPLQDIIIFDDTETYVSKQAQVYEPKIPLAKFDKCPSEYYLMWQDRMGGIQSQPLKNKPIYSESFNQTMITNYQNHKRSINSEIQPEWTLMTDWIDDEFYPIWESIFSSAYLTLYNAKLDRSYSVIVTDKQFTQKTHKNQRNLFKLTIKLQLDKPQNIIS